MTWPKALLRLQLTRGLNSDTPPTELKPEAWSLVTNAGMAPSGFLSTAPPTRDAYTELPEGEIMHVVNVNAEGNNAWLAAYEDEVHVAIGTNTFDITPASITASEPKHYHSTTLNGVPVLLSELNEPWYWDLNPGNALTPLADWPSGYFARNIVSFRNHLFAMNFTTPVGEAPDLVLWSDAAPAGSVPGSWTPGIGSQAGEARLSSTPGPALTGAVMRGSLLLYKSSSIYAVDYTNDETFPFQVSLLFAGRGALNARSVTPIGDGRHFVVGDRCVYLFDGGQAIDIGAGRVADALFQDLEPSAFELLQVVHVGSRSQVWVLYPSSGSSRIDKALVYSYVHDNWTKLSLAPTTHAEVGVVNDSDASGLWQDADYFWKDAEFVWGADIFKTVTMPLVLAGDGLLEVGRGTVDAPTTLRRTGLTFGKPERTKFIRRVHIRASGEGTIAVRVGGQWAPDGAISFEAPQTFTVGTDSWIDCTVTTRFAAIDLQLTGNIAVYGVELEGDLRGYV